jgi:wyosine [tRNA(Phe)-imidazoG37] synthetase (radical SAM superfamily)
VGTDQEEDMSVLELQRGVIYGPASRKVCTFDCVYCQYGKAGAVSLTGVQGGFPSVSTVLQEVEGAIMRQQTPPDYPTFSGNGEPTLHPEFAEIVAEVLHLRDRLCPAASVAILSNSSTAHRPEIREAIEQLDDPIMKLDAGDPDALSRINRPAPAVTLEKIVEGLAGMARLIVQSMIIAGEPQNAEGAAHEAWLSTLARLSPEKVQIYTAERPVPESGVRRVSREDLESLAERARERTGIPVGAY